MPLRHSGGSVWEAPVCIAKAHDVREFPPRASLKIRFPPPFLTKYVAPNILHRVTLTVKFTKYISWYIYLHISDIILHILNIRDLKLFSHRKQVKLTSKILLTYAQGITNKQRVLINILKNLYRKK